MSNDTSKTQKPQNEIVVQFKKLESGDIVVCFFDVHGAEMKQAAKKAGLPVKAFGDKAAEFGGKLTDIVKTLGLTRHGFTTKTGKRYYSYHAVVSG